MDLSGPAVSVQMSPVVRRTLLFQVLVLFVRVGCGGTIVVSDSTTPHRPWGSRASKNSGVLEKRERKGPRVPRQAEPPRLFRTGGSEQHGGSPVVSAGRTAAVRTDH